MKRIAIFIIVLLAAISTASAYTANFSNGFKIQDDALNNVFMVNKQGDVNFTGRMYGNGSGLTDLPASAVADVWVNASGDAMTGTLNVNNNVNISSSGDLNATGQTLLTKLGIGISKPTYMLHTGNGTDGAAVNLSNIIYINSTSGNILIGPGNTSNALDLTRQGRYMLNITGNMSVNNTFFVNTNGNVGIGTTTPASALHVIGSINASVSFKAANGTQAAPSYTFNDDTNTGFIKPHEDNISIVTGGITRMVIDPSGNVGIGTTSPGSSLDIQTDQGIVGESGNGIRVINTVTTGHATGLTLGNNLDGTTRNLVRLQATAGTQTGIMQFYTRTSDAAGMTEKMRIDATGNVGIGTTSPDEPLTVVGAIRGSTSVADGSAIAKARGRSAYLVIVSSNYDTGNSVRSAIYHVLTNNEGTAVTNTNTVSTYNSQAATFSVSGGNLIISGLSAGNNQVAVFGS